MSQALFRPYYGLNRGRYLYHGVLPATNLINCRARKSDFAGSAIRLLLDKGQFLLLFSHEIKPDIK
jgi:hypothetical protein